MRIDSTFLAAIVAATLLAACGDSSPPKPALPAKMAAKAPERPSDGLPEPKCPGKIDRALSGPDVVGLKLGMPRDDALNFARCLNKETLVAFEGAWIQGLRGSGINNVKL